MKQYSCPDCWCIDNVDEFNPCGICKKSLQTYTQLWQNPYWIDTTYKIVKYENPNPCDKCSTNPKNGGNGLCLCTLGNKFRIAY